MRFFLEVAKTAQRFQTAAYDECSFTLTFSLFISISFSLFSVSDSKKATYSKKTG